MPNALTLDLPDLPASESVSSFRPGPRDLLAVGELLAGIYEVRAKVGEGGMGQVYEAWDRSLGRRVAVKAAAPAAKASLSQEARALATLRHPNIVAVHGLGEHGRIPYVVMEWVPGKTLEAHLDELNAAGAGFGLAEVLDILIGMADALAVVHSAGMAHRDVKPGNVMLAPGDRVVLTDFGVFQSESEAIEGLHCGGSPHYMAPEAIAVAVDSGELYLVDVYSLGVVAYQMLTGQVPYDDARVLKILWLHANAPIPDPRTLRHDAPPRLAALVHEMLAKDPKDRPQSMAGIAWQLRALRDSARRDEPRCSVLIVDDNAATAVIVSSIVTEASSHAEVRIASNGHTALDMVRHRVPDVLVVDLHLPGMSGVELCRLIGDTRAADWTKVIATSALATAAEIATVTQLGTVEFVPKGDALATRLHVLVGRAGRRPGATTGR